MPETVKVTRRYQSARTGQLVDALSPEGWAALLARIDALTPLSVVPFAEPTQTGVLVTVATSRGPAGAYAVHDLACRYGALAVITY